MLYPRLALARSLLRSDGILCVSIDEHEHHNLVLLLCEIFGEENHLGDFVWKKKSGGGSDSRALVLDHEYIVCFARSSSSRLRDDPIARDVDVVVSTETVESATVRLPKKPPHLLMIALPPSVTVMELSRLRDDTLKLPACTRRSAWTVSEPVPLSSSEAVPGTTTSLSWGAC